MKKSELIFINELINSQIIKKYILLSRTEYSQNNPNCVEKHMKWKYLNNPLGFSYGINGYLQDNLMARVSYQRKNFIFKNKIIKGANLCDLLINKTNRKLHNFLKLTSPFFIKKEIPDSNLAIMLPNEISINIYKKILNLKPIGSLELRFFPILSSIIQNKLKIKIPSLLKSLLDNLLLSIVKFLQAITKIVFSMEEADNAVYEKMIKNYYKDNLIQGERSKKWLNWRYSSLSTIKYFLEYIYLGNQLIGYFVYREVEKYNHKLLMIMEIVIIKKNFFIELTILLKLIFLANRLNSDLILTLRSTQKSNPLSNLLFPKMPNFFLPTPLEFFLISKRGLSSQLLDLKNWKINMADFDIF